MRNKRDGSKEWREKVRENQWEGAVEVEGYCQWTVSDLDCVYEIVCLNLQAVLSHGSNTSLDLDTSLSRAQNMGQL